MVPHSVSAMWSAIAPGLGNHLWQSTLFACVAGLLTMALRSNQARARYWVWMTASAKFLIPFSLLVGLGCHLTWPHPRAASKTRVYVAMEQASLPFAEPMAMESRTLTKLSRAMVPPGPQPSIRADLARLVPGILMGVWLCGFVAVLLRWWMRWRHVAAVLRAGQPLVVGREVEMLRRLQQHEIGGMRRPIDMVETSGSLEPGIFGIARPVLMWPEGISAKLDDAHLQAVLTHELWHVRRGDNLAAAMHMLVEAIFWFYPLVWWLGKRLSEERERACDEEVLQLCNRREIYAESILKVCEFCVASPLSCVSGVTGADLKKRIMQIMTEHVGRKLNLSRKLLLATVGLTAIGVPIIAGTLNASISLAQVAHPTKVIAAVSKAAMAMKTVEPMLAAAIEAKAEPQASPVARDASTPASTTAAQEPGDIAGDWQGTLQWAAQGDRPGGKLRIIVKIAKAANGGWSALDYSIDQNPQGMSCSNVSLREGIFSYAIPSIDGSYQGRLSPDRNSIAGQWTQGGSSLPLVYVRATKETAWEIPAPPAPPTPMAADANPAFEVATIKPSNPDQPGNYFQVRGRNFVVHNESLASLIEFAYGVQAKQIVNAPDWVDKDKYDIHAVPDGEGQPNSRQWKTMLQKLLADRFALTFHHEKRELAVFALTVGKDGPKNLAVNPSAGPLPGLFFAGTPGGISLPARNATMAEFAQVMQEAVLDRPVVDQTGLTPRYDFMLKWAPDESQFGGHPPPASDDPSAPPNLFTAVQEQLGLKLEAVKLPVDVIVIDQAKKSTAD
jgi:uncharacterized protein (TIGR03435 family)